MNGLFAFAGDHPTGFNVPAPVRVSQIGTWARGAEIDLPTMTTPAINSSTGTDSVPPAEGRWRLKKFVMGWESRWFEIDVAVADGEEEARLLRKNGGKGRTSILEIVRDRNRIRSQTETDTEIGLN